LPCSPIGFGWQVHESVFDHVGHRTKPHDFLNSWHIAGHAVSALSDQFLNELCAGSFVFDRSVRWLKLVSVTPHRNVSSQDGSSQAGRHGAIGSWNPFPVYSHETQTARFWHWCSLKLHQCRDFIGLCVNEKIEYNMPARFCVHLGTSFRFGPRSSGMRSKASLQ
jgi:hypothetical protein